MIIRIVLPALALGCLAAPLAAAGQSERVAYSDLDLTNPEGRAALEQRLNRAVRKVCGGAVPQRHLAAMREHRACLAEARASYQQQYALALDTANARRVAILANKIGLLASF